jgi:hypothetical protein
MFLFTFPPMGAMRGSFLPGAVCFARRKIKSGCTKLSEPCMKTQSCPLEESFLKWLKTFIYTNCMKFFLVHPNFA